MPMNLASVTEGCEYTEHWRARVSSPVSTGERVFLYTVDGVYPNDQTPVTLPVIGDPFAEDDNDDIAVTGNDPWDGMWCRKRRVEPINGDTNAFSVICSYNNEPWDKTGALGSTSAASALPRVGTSGGEYQQIESNQTPWIWKSDSVRCQQGFYKRIGVTSFSLLKIVAAPGTDPNTAVAKLTTYLSTYANPLMGKINSRAFMEYDAGVVLYEGAELRMVMDHMSCPSFHMHLAFSVRTVTGESGDYNDGWLFVLRTKGTNAGQWAIPVSSEATYLYQEADLNTLFS